MAEIKTTKNDASVEAFLKKTVKDEEERKDCEVILKMMKQASRQEPQMWGASIIGFGIYQYKSPTTNRSGDWFMLGFSPRKQNLTVYLMPGIAHYKDLVSKLGKCKTGGSCLYIRKLADVDVKVLKELINTAYKNMKAITGKK